MALIDAGMEEWGHAGRFNYAQSVSIVTDVVAGPWSRYSFKPDSVTGILLGGNRSEVVVGCRVYWTPPDPPGTGAEELIAVLDAGTDQLRLRVTNGSLQLYRGNTLLADSAGKALSPRRWYFVEFRAVIANAGGIGQVWVDEGLWIDFSGDTQETANASGDAVTFNGFTYWRYDDVYVLDSAGTVNNSRLGDIACAGLKVAGAGDVAQFTPVGAAANWDCVDEIPPDDATTYVHSSTVNQRDLHALEDMPAELTDVKAVVLGARAQKSDAGTANVALGVKYDSNGDGTPDTESWGTDDPLSTSWAYHKRVLDQHPDGTPWTRAKVNALQVGYQAR